MPLEAGAKIGQRIGFSDNDLVKINKLYNCPNQPSQNGQFTRVSYNSTNI